MRAHLLLTSLRDVLREALKDFPLPKPDQEGLGPTALFVGGLPDDGVEDLPARFPFALMLWTVGDDDEPGDGPWNCEETVQIILGVYCPSTPEEAELVTAALMDHLRQALMRNRLLAEIFDLQLPVKSAKPEPEKRQHQYHVATIVTRWNHRTPRRLLHDKGESYAP